MKIVFDSFLPQMELYSRSRASMDYAIGNFFPDVR